ncbi:hypothetical protein JQ604_41305 [Bradyrhizobium jicamae]|uniref:hypothetical protein n=1 Tax=Bradyrhizobium jicamae TaxID=280332 RepID=UPI001BA678F2|nr:hypothetical protein [Bradyrhizobium jicamae]MBR0758657.1 hypothetical protein [Bradyrhizobium jicamae]
MNVSIRFYLFADDGVFRISPQLMMRLIHDRDAMPKYAGTKQKAVDVIIELENGKPVRIARADGSYLTFDEKGHIHGSLIASGSAAMETYDALDKELKNPPGKVVEIGAKLNREKWERENRWTLSKTADRG